MTDSADGYSWLRRAAALLEEVMANDDDYGALANAEADDLRDALRVAADRLRVAQGRPPRGAWWTGTRRLVAEAWGLVEDGELNARSPLGDAALDMRDIVDPGWSPSREEERLALRHPMWRP